MPELGKRRNELNEQDHDFQDGTALEPLQEVPSQLFEELALPRAKPPLGALAPDYAYIATRA
jgi:hypothetical protein